MVGEVISVSLRSDPASMMIYPVILQSVPSDPIVARSSIDSMGVSLGFD